MNLKKLNEMISEPASKEWFKKHGHSKAEESNPLKKKMAKKIAKKMELPKKFDNKEWERIHYAKGKWGASAKEYKGLKGEYSKHKQGNFMKVHPLDR